MKYLQITMLGLLALMLFTVAADGQKRATKKTAAKKPAAQKTILPPLEVRAAREKVSNQLANVNRFIDVLGPIAQGIETLDRTDQNLSKAAADRNEANKQKVIGAIRNLKAGLSDLESEFRTKPDLQKYLESIQGITDLLAQSEDMAIAGKFVGSKDPLRSAAQKLKDTLAMMPLSPEI